MEALVKYIEQEKESHNVYIPVPEIDMLKTDSRLTVCELLRRIYARTEDKEIKYLCRVATSLAKFTYNRVSKHEGTGWGKGVWAKNPDFRRVDS